MANTEIRDFNHQASGLPDRRKVSESIERNLVTPFEKSYPRSLHEYQEDRGNEVTINLMPQESTLANIVTNAVKKTRDSRQEMVHYLQSSSKKDEKVTNTQSTAGLQDPQPTQQSQRPHRSSKVQMLHTMPTAREEPRKSDLKAVKFTDRDNGNPISIANMIKNRSQKRKTVGDLHAEVQMQLDRFSTQ